MRGKYLLLAIFVTLFILVTLACRSGTGSSNTGKKSIVVIYSILGSLVKELVGNEADVIISIPNGRDPHDWEPSAKDIEAINHADLIVQNGLGLEDGMKKALEGAKGRGIRIFTASDYITIRRVGPGEGIPTGDPDQAVGAQDPHLWTDPVAMKSIIAALAINITVELGIDISGRASDLETRLGNLDKEVASLVSAIPSNNRKLVTGHESLGYFAQRYGFKLVGAIVPSLTTQAEISAADLADLKKLIQGNKVNAIFTELGTPPAVAIAIGRETGVKVVELSTHLLPEDGSYFTFLLNMAKDITDGLK